MNYWDSITLFITSSGNKKQERKKKHKTFGKTINNRKVRLETRLQFVTRCKLCSLLTCFVSKKTWWNASSIGTKASPFIVNRI